MYSYVNNKWTNIIKIFLKIIQIKYNTSLYFGHYIALIISNYLIENNKEFIKMSYSINENDFDHNIKYHKILYYRIPKILYVDFIYKYPYIFPKLKYFDKEYTVAAINKSPSMIQYLDQNNVHHNDIIKYAIKKDFKLIRFIKDKNEFNI